MSVSIHETDYLTKLQVIQHVVADLDPNILHVLTEMLHYLNPYIPSVKIIL